MKSLFKELVLLIIGGAIYLCIEILYRGYSHWSMFLVGGLCFVSIGAINEQIPWDLPVPWQMLIGAVVVTIIEFDSGLVLNLALGLDVWDYSSLPFNILGQVCLPFCLAWYFLSFVGIVLDDWLRYWLFGEERPTYCWRIL